MAQQIFRIARHLALPLMALVFSPGAFAQQTEDSSETLKLHRPDNHATQKESISGGACVVETGAFPVGFNAYVVPEGTILHILPFARRYPPAP